MPLRPSHRWTAVLVVLAVGALGYGAWWLAYAPGDAVVVALSRHAAGPGKTSELVAALIMNYEDTRANATMWSGVFWGFSFAALVASAAAGVVLKMDSLKIGEPARKDVAAALAFVAAVLVGVSTTGEFQRKWQANRLAAAKLEKLGYDFLADAKPDAFAYFRSIGEIQYERTVQITGKQAGEAPPPGRAASAPAG